MAELVKPKRNKTKQRKSIPKTSRSVTSTEITKESEVDLKLSSYDVEDLEAAIVLEVTEYLKTHELGSDISISEAELTDSKEAAVCNEELPNSVIELEEDVFVGLEVTESSEPCNKDNETVEGSSSCQTCEETVAFKEENVSTVNEYQLIETPYNCVVDKLREYQEEIAIPSAPALETHIFEECVENATVHEIKEREIVKQEGPFLKDLLNTFSIEWEIETLLVPFDDNHLSLLYQNEELEAVDSFLHNFALKNIPENDELYKTMARYVQIRKEFADSIKQVEDDKELLLDVDKSIWTVWPEVELKEKALCGDSKVVWLTHKHQKARLNVDALTQFAEILDSIQTLNKKNLDLGVAVKYYKCQIEYLICGIQDSIRPFTKDNLFDPNNTSSSFLKETVEKLSHSLDVLFHFLRIVPNSVDNELVEELKYWLSIMLTCLVKIGSWREHLFILCHVLYCPSSIALWAADFVQCPPRLIDHACALLALIIQPIPLRDKFLENRQVGAWVLLDSNGLDDDEDINIINEEVLLKLFNQVPLQQLLVHFIVTETRNISDHAVLKLLAFFNTLLKQLRQGIVTCAENQHRHFGKRLAKLIRELVELATDQFDLYLETFTPTPRLQAEYDGFLLRATEALMTKPLAWQFLVSAPFYRASYSCKWLIYLKMTFTQTYQISYAEFANKLSLAYETEQCHLLTALTNLALSDGATNKVLIRTIALQLLHIGYVHELTSSFFYKDAKTLLASIFNQHCYLFAESFDLYDMLIANNELQETNSQLDLWKNLPVETWILTRNDLNNLCKWLTFEFSTNRCEIARYILRNLDYTAIDFNGQYLIARTIVCASKNSKEFTNFTWSVLKKLRLHVIDRGFSCSDTSIFSTIPNLSDDAELGYLVTQNLPTAIFFALETTSVGHFVPLIYSDGFKLLKQLVDMKCYEGAFSSINHTTSLFWGCTESLLSHQDFLKLISYILSLPGDSYLSLVKTNETENILQLFSTMLHAHLEKSGVDNIENAVKLWMRILVNLQNWQLNDNIVYILDVVCRYAFNHPGAWESVLDILEAHLQFLPSTERSALSNFLRLGNPSIPTLLPRGSNGLCAWFAFAALTVEFNYFEKKTCLWSELIRELSRCKGKKTNVDASLKKVCIALKLPIRTSSQLTFYKYAYQILEMSESDPLNVLIWKQFMELFLTRVVGLVDHGRPGACFFHGIINCNLLHRLIEKLKKLSESQTNLSSTFKSLILWLQEPIILEPNLMPECLPAQYNAPILSACLSGESYPWYVLLPISEIRGILTKKAQIWDAVLGRLNKQHLSKPNVTVKPPKTRIFDRLDDIVCSNRLPNVSVLQMSIRSLDKDTTIVCNVEKMVKILDSIKSLLDRNNILVNITKELYYSMPKTTPLLQHCSGVKRDNFMQRCSSPARITLSYLEWHMNFDKKQEHDLLLTKVQSDVIGNFLLVNFDIWSFFYTTHVTELLKKETTNDISPLLMEYFVEILKVWKIARNWKLISEMLIKSITDIGMSVKLDKSFQLIPIVQEIINDSSATFLVDFFNPNFCRGNEFIKTLTNTLFLLRADSGLLDRFDVNQWLLGKQTSMATANLLSVILNALSSPERTPHKQPTIHYHLNMFLRQILVHDFTEHYGQVFQTLVESETRFYPETWYTFINVLLPSDQCIESKDVEDIENLISKIGKCATEQKLLSLSVLRKSIQFLDKTWTSFGADIKRKNWYSHFLDSAEPVIIIHSYFANCFIVRFIAEQTFTLTEEAINSIWPVVESSYKPWLTPIMKNSLVEKLPFDSTDARLSTLAATLFRDSLLFLMNCLSRSEIILNRILDFYVQNYCSTEVPGHILSIIHATLNSLPWKQMKPTIQNVESMLQVVNCCVPLCHEFLGQIFISVDWKTVIQENFITQCTEVSAYLHTCLLHLLVKFPSEPSLKQKKEVIKLLDIAVEFGWHVLSADSYLPILTWCTCNCNPDVVLSDPDSDYHQQDTKILRLLKVAAGYDVEITHFHWSTREKRRIFVGGMVKCLATVACKRRKWSSNDIIQTSISNLLTDIEIIVSSTVAENERLNEACTLLSEILMLLTESKLEQRVEEAFLAWMSNNSHKSCLVSIAMLRCLGTIVANPIIYSNIIEKTINHIFIYSGIRDWPTISQLLVPYANGTVYLDEVLISNSCLLTLYTMYQQRLGVLPKETSETGTILNNLLRFLPTVKPNEENEPKLILLIGLAIRLSILKSNDVKTLQKICDISTAYLAEQSGGFLTAIGLKKQNVLSSKMRICCLTIAAGLSTVMMAEFNHESRDKSWQLLRQADANKQLNTVMIDLLVLRNELSVLKNATELVIFVYEIAAKLFNKYYFHM